MIAQVICGDCLEVMRGMEAGYFDAVVTDPPYGIDYQSAWRTDPEKRHPKIRNDGQPFVWWAYPAAGLVSADGGRVLCFCRWDTAEAFRLALTWSGLTLRAQIIWDRQHHGMGDTRGAPSPRHDIIWYATSGRYEFQNGRPCSVVSAARLSGDALTHPNEKPLDLMRQLVASYSSEGETILDPFCGSGTTGVACVKTGRNFVGIEINEEYCEIARKRIAQAQGTQPSGADQQPMLFGGNETNGSD